MFDSYDNLPEDYIPNNMFPIPPVIALTANDDNLITKRNCRGLIYGFEWHYGDTVAIPISLNLEIYVYPNDLICKEQGQEPSSFYDIGEIGDRFYNTADLKSWRLDSIIDVPGYTLLEKEPYNFHTHFYNYYELVDDEYVNISSEVDFVPNIYWVSNNLYVWVQDPLITFFSDGVTPVVLTPDLEGKSTKVYLTNFRHEKIEEFEFFENEFNVEINSELSNKLNPGIYYLTVQLCGTDNSSVSLINNFEITVSSYKVV